MPMGNDVLIERLRLASASDLSEIAEHLRIALPKGGDPPSEQDLHAVASELRSAAGHTVMNMARRARKTQLAYRDILIDVADKLTPGLVASSGFKTQPWAREGEIENYISQRLQEITITKIEAMSEDDRRTLQQSVEQELRQKGIPEATIHAVGISIGSGLVSGLVLGSAASAALTASLWSILVGATLRQALIGSLAVGGPIGIVVGVGMLLTSPSYRKIIPAVVRLVLVRMNHEQRQELQRS